MPLSTYAANKVLNHLSTNTAFTLSSPLYMALCTTVPTAASTGATLVEATYTGYARQSVAGSAWNSATNGTASNASAISFATCTAGSSTVVGWALCDSATTGAGNVIWWGTCPSTAISTSQNSPAFVAGSITLTAS